MPNSKRQNPTPPVPAQGEEVRKPNSLNSSRDYNDIRDRTESLEKSEEEMKDL